MKNYGEKLFIENVKARKVEIMKIRIDEKRRRRRRRKKKKKKKKRRTKITKVHICKTKNQGGRRTDKMKG